MARGDSGRIVVEVDPHLKNDLYVELAKQRLTLKAWFMETAQRYIAQQRQPQLFAAEPMPVYGATPSDPEPNEDR